MKKKAISFFVIISLLILSTVSQVGAAPLLTLSFLIRLSLMSSLLTTKGNSILMRNRSFSLPNISIILILKKKHIL